MTQVYEIILWAIISIDLVLAGLIGMGGLIAWFAERALSASSVAVFFVGLLVFMASEAFGLWLLATATVVRVDYCPTLKTLPPMPMAEEVRVLACPKLENLQKIVEEKSA